MARSEKRLLRNFLEQYLDSGEMKSLQWVNKEKNIFQLLWLHSNSPSWGEEDGALFKQWAIYKGRYKQLGDGTMPLDDYTNWKASFRCAINRCNDILMLTNETGHKELRRYQFVDRKSATGTPQPLMMWHSGHDGEDSESVDSDYSSKATGRETQSKTLVMPTNTDTYAIAAFASDTENQFIPDVVAALPVSPPSSIGVKVVVEDDGITPSTSNFLSSPEIDPEVEEQIINYGVDISDLLKWHPNDAERNVYSLLDIASLEASGIDPQHSMTNVSLPESLSLLKFTGRPNMIDMCVWLRYRERVVGKHYIRDERGCRVVNVDGEKHSDIPERYTGCKLIGLPPPGNTNMMRDVDDITELIVNNLGNGVHLFCDTDGNIFATRLTSCRIYYADPTLKAAGEPQMLPRKQPVKVFDRESFSKNLAQWEKGARGERPSVSGLLAVGENWSLTKPINKCKINLTIVHAYSWFQRMNIKENAPLMDFDDAVREQTPLQLRPKR